MDHTGTIVATNLEWKRLAGGSGARAQATTGIGANYLTACNRAQGDGAGPGRAAAAGIRSVLAGTTSSFELDYPGGTPSGPRWFTMRVAPLPLASGAAVIMHLDVTDRHLAESALRLSEARANATFAHAPIGICWLDHAGVVVEVNPALTAIIGRPADQIVGKYPTAFWHSDAAGGIGADFGRLVRGELNSYARERRLLRSDGSVRHLYVAVSVVRPPDDEGPPMAIATVEDVTELRRLADELHRAQELEALGRLAGGIAHEINTPIQFIGDNLRFLADALPELIGPTSGLAPAEAAGTSSDGFEMSVEIPAAIEQSLEGVARVATIVGAMKAFGQRDGTRPAPADLNEALRTTLVIASHEFKYVADIEVELGDIPAVPCYVGELSQVFLNLVVNGAQAIAERVSGTADRGRITARTWPGDGSAYISISDTGTGIPAAVAEHVYEPFFTTKALGKGTGQGLSVARATIVNRHGGTIDFTTKAGEGTTFTIRIPTTWAGE